MSMIESNAVAVRPFASRYFTYTVFVPAPGVDILKAAQGVQKSTNEMCLRCHAGAGGGLNHKHGVTPTPQTDIHMAKGMQCQACHTVKNHKIAGGADLKAQELLDIKIDCSNCHTDKPHKGDSGVSLNDHTRRIACQTCHIPEFARGQATKMLWDWSTAGKRDKNGKPRRTGFDITSASDGTCPLPPTLATPPLPTMPARPGSWSQ